RERVRDERYREACVVERSDGERRAVDGDRALLDAVPQYVAGRVEPREPICASAQRADAVDVTLHDVPAERIAGAQCRLDVHLVTGGEAAERRAVERLCDDVEGERAVVALGDR